MAGSPSAWPVVVWLEAKWPVVAWPVVAWLEASWPVVRVATG